MDEEIKSIRLSVSKAKTYDQCKRKFYYQYILKLPTTSKDYNALGSMVHLVLENLFRKWIDSGYKDDLKELLKVSWKESLDTKEGEEAKRFNVMSRVKDHVLSYYNSFIERENTVPIEVECNFELKMRIGGEVIIELMGFIDRIDKKEDGTIVVLDYKTTNKVQYLDYLQLGVYVAACKHKVHKGSDFKYEAAYILLKHDNVMKQAKDIDTLYQKHLNKIVRIGIEIRNTMSDGHYPPSYSPLCNYCEFKQRCDDDLKGRDSW